MADSDPSYIFPCEFLIPKIEPKPEPVETPNPNHNAGDLPEISPFPSGEDEIFAEHSRLANVFLSNYYGPVNGPGDVSGSAVVPAALRNKSRARSGEMVRIGSLSPQEEFGYKALVRRTRITFESLRLLIIRDERISAALGVQEGRWCRADLKSAALMKNRDLWLNRNFRMIGSIPGISVGDAYFFRMELCVVGLHGQTQAGIDYIPASLTSSREPIATSIIVSGGYEDDDDKGYELIYTGQGGQDHNLHKHFADQQLVRGNLGLERSMTYGIEIRVIRMVKTAWSPTGKVYIYDGLYNVVQCWLDVGKSGFGVYKYRMLRIEGQEEMGTMNMKIAKELKVNPLNVRHKGYLSFDISNGKENMPVALFNDIDDDHEPLLFQYSTFVTYPPAILQKLYWDCGYGCRCVRNCTVDCHCTKMDGGELVYHGSGILLRGKPVIYECGPSCHCPPSCPNRVSQNGVKNRLEVFRSLETGWGVRSLDLIQAGSFICEFKGDVQVEEVSSNNLGFVSPSRFPTRWMEWGDISDVFPDYRPPRLPSLPTLKFSIDTSRARNVASYISHSYSPNVFLQYVLYDHYNVAFPHLMIFALENIPPMRELSIDYGAIEEWIGNLTMQLDL